MVQLGWKAAPEQYGPNDLLKFSVAAEQSGFDFIESSDHFQPWDPAGQAPFTWTYLGAVAARTQKIAMGTGITCPIIRYEPSIVAQMAATLAVMAPGRVYLSVGTGEALNEYAATGLWPDYDERQAMLKEAISLIRQLWSGKEVSFDGEYYETKKAKLYTLPSQPIPLYVSSLVPASSAFAGAEGDGLITTGGEKPDHYHKMLHQFEQGARSAGRDAGKMPKLIELNVAYTDNMDEAIKLFRKYWAGSVVPALFDRKIYTPEDSARNGKVVGDEIIKQRGCFSPNAEDHVKFARHYIDLGFTHLIFHTAGPDQERFLERYGRDVLPHLRQYTGQQSGQPTTEQNGQPGIQQWELAGGRI